MENSKDFGNQEPKFEIDYIFFRILFLKQGKHHNDDDRLELIRKRELQSVNCNIIKTKSKSQKQNNIEAASQSSGLIIWKKINK